MAVSLGEAVLTERLLDDDRIGPGECRVGTSGFVPLSERTDYKTAGPTPRRILVRWPAAM
jgi:hypothetical protein